MCYECGCGHTNTVMSDDSITDETFKKAAKGAGISVEKAKKRNAETVKERVGRKIICN